MGKAAGKVDFLSMMFEMQCRPNPCFRLPHATALAHSNESSGRVDHFTPQFPASARRPLCVVEVFSLFSRRQLVSSESVSQSVSQSVGLYPAYQTRVDHRPPSRYYKPLQSTLFHPAAKINSHSPSSRLHKAGIPDPLNLDVSFSRSA